MSAQTETYSECCGTMMLDMALHGDHRARRQQDVLDDNIRRPPGRTPSNTAVPETPKAGRRFSLRLPGRVLGSPTARRRLRYRQYLHDPRSSKTPIQPRQLPPRPLAPGSEDLPAYAFTARVSAPRRQSLLNLMISSGQRYLRCLPYLRRSARFCQTHFDLCATRFRSHQKRCCSAPASSSVTHATNLTDGSGRS